MPSRTRTPHQVTPLRALLAIALAATTVAATPPEPGSRAADRVIAAFDFDDGLQGWTIETPSPLGSSWSILPDRDDWDNGPNARHAGNPGFNDLDVPDGDHHLAIESYANDSDTTATSPVLTGDGTRVEVSMDLRFWVEGGDYDFGTVAYQEIGEQDWTELGWIGRRAEDDPRGRVGEGRGRYPMWDPASYAFTPTGDFRIRFRFVSDFANDGEDRRSRDDREWAGWYARNGFGIWIDDVVVTASGSASPQAEADHDAVANPAPTSHDGAGALPGTARADLDLPDPGPLSPGPDTGLRAGPRDRALDQATHPEYQGMMSQPGLTIDQRLSDPYHWDWAQTGGRERHVWIVNRYDTPLAGTLFAPRQPGRYPAVVFVGSFNGGGNAAFYTSFLQRIAEAGYVVLSVAPQFRLALASWGPAKDPAPEFCGDPDATADLWWRQPQEAGLTEPGFCAGHLGAPSEDVASLVVATRTDGDQAARDTAEVYRHGHAHTFTFAGIDAAHWLVSQENPWRHLVDPRAIGITGHSAGGFAAVVGANADPLIRAAVGIDQYGTTFDGLELSAPTLLVNYEGAALFTGTDLTTSVHQNPIAIAEAARDAGQDAGFLVVRDAEHYDLAYEPSDFDQLQSNSRWAQAVTLHYLLGWFDRHLKDDATAARRLTADRFDHTVDRSARGQGRWDPVLGNVPYRIGGEAVADHLSARTDDWIHLDGITHAIG